MRRPLILVTVCAFALASRASDDEVRFKTKAYAPRQTLRDSTYRESVYTPSRNPQPIGNRVETPSAPSRWRLFDREKELATQKKLADLPLESEQAYTQQKRISVVTLKPDPQDVPEYKPFEEHGSKLTDATYKAKDGTREKNPLLAPRQGIKAPASE
jgi:hypothetical protein